MWVSSMPRTTASKCFVSLALKRLNGSRRQRRDQPIQR